MDSETFYLQQYNETVVEESQREELIQGKFPFHNSVWKSTYKRYVNVQESNGDLLRCTFLSGGQIHMPFMEYKESLVSKSTDIENGVVLTDVEIAHNCEGIRLFFEMDYRSSDCPMPTLEDAMIHLRVLHRTVSECFTTDVDLTMHIATCDRKRKQKRSSKTIELAWGIHVVFPYIVTTTPIMKLIAQLVDTRISNLFPKWQNIIDPASYRSSNATLRPCFSYKMIECPICSMGKKKTKECGTKRKLDTNLESLFRLQLSESCTCFNGRRVDSSIYTYAGTLHDSDDQLSQCLHSVLDVLMEMSIVPKVMGIFTPGFTRPSDMGDEHDVIPNDSIVFPSEKRIVNGFDRRKNTVQMNHSKFPDGFKSILSCIVGIHECYKHIAIHKLSMDEDKKVILVTVKGKGSRYCMFTKKFHNSNRVYFVFGLKRSYIQVNCFDPDCRKEHSDKPLRRSLSLMDKYRILDGFGIPNTMVRPTISPVVDVHHLSKPDSPGPVVVDSVLKKRRMWEEKRKLYLQS